MSRLLLKICFLVFCLGIFSSSRAQVSTYNFFQTMETYAPGASAGVPAALPAMAADKSLLHQSKSLETHFLTLPGYLKAGNLNFEVTSGRQYRQSLSFIMK